MLACLRKSSLVKSSPMRKRAAHPLLEGLEDRLLLYSTLSAQWTYGSRITFSFVPDGTSIGGTPSVLFQTLNAKFSTATWQQQFQKAAAVWQNVTNINLAQVSDDGSALGANGNQQDDSRFGDIRISAIPQSSGTLATCFLPPPINGGSDAGDIVFNSNVNWQVNSTYDLETVAIHEIGHALGMGHSQITTADMYAYYNGVKQSLTSDDTSGIQSIYGTRQYDQFNSNGNNNGSYTRATNINSYIDGNGQVAIPSLNITTTGQSEWFLVTVPSSTTGTMVVTAQSSNLSLLSPRLAVYSTSLSLLGQASSTKYGDTVMVSMSGVQPGQSYYVKTGGTAGGNMVGGYGLELNFGSQSQLAQLPIPPPNTVVLQQPDQGGGSLNLAQGPSHGHLPPSLAGKFDLIKIGNFTAWGETLGVATRTPVLAPDPNTLVPSVTGWQTVSALAPLDSANTVVSTQPCAVGAAVNVLPSIDSVSLAFLSSSPAVLQALDNVLASWSSQDHPSLLGDGDDLGASLTV